MTSLSSEAFVEVIVGEHARYVPSTCSEPVMIGRQTFIKNAVSRETVPVCEECSCKFAEHRRHSKKFGRLITVGEDL